MKTGIKKTITIIACLIMILGVIGIGALSVSAASGTCGDNLTWVYDGHTQTLTISGTGEMESYSSIYFKGNIFVTSAPWWSYYNSMKNVVINSGVTSIGNRAFYGCTGLARVTIGNRVTSIGQAAFCNCTGLTSITIPDSVTSIDFSAFENSGYYNQEVNWTYNVLYIGKHLIKAKTEITSDYSIKANTKTIAMGAFSNCTGLTGITIPDSVTSIGYSVFSNCTGLTSITIPDSVTIINGDAFYGCTGLKSITIPDSVTNIGYRAFYECTGLTSITIPDSVTSIGEYAFYECTGLTSITIPDSVTSIDGWAFHCAGLTSIIISNSVTSIGRGAFAECGYLTTVTIGNGVTSIGDFAFFACPITDVYFTGSEEEWNAIVIGLDNNDLRYANIHYNSDYPSNPTPTAHVKINCINAVKYGVKGVDLPADGIMADCEVPYTEGMTAMDALKAAAKLKGIEFVESHGYVRGIGGLYEKDCSGSSGWIFNVNGEYPNVSCDKYKLNENDTMTFIYTAEQGDVKLTPTEPTPTETTPTETEPVHEHSYNVKTTKEPTCTEDGIMTYACSCGDSYTEEIPALGHSFTNYRYNNDATTEKDGTETAKCDRCNVTATRTAAGTKIIPENHTLTYDANGGSGAPAKQTGSGYVSISNTKPTRSGYNFLGWATNKGATSVQYGSGSPIKLDKDITLYAVWQKNTSTDIPEANVIKGNSADNKKTYDYRTSVTFTANVPEGGKVQWYVDGKPASNDSTLTVKDKTGDYTVKAVVTDKNGNQTMDEEQVTIKHGFFDIIIWFFVHLFNPGKYDVKQ